MIHERYLLTRKLPVMMVCLLCASSAMAASYSIAEGYGADQIGMCQSVRKALTEGLVLDSERPLCQRRFELSSKAKSLGLSEIEKKLLPPSVYPGLMREMLPIVGQEKTPQSKADQDVIEKIIAQHMKNDDLKIYISNFDADNSGKIRKVYISDITLCENRNSYWDSSVTTAIENTDGSLDRSWGVHDTTAGIPFIYNNHTYYVKWDSLAGNADKHMLAQLNIYESRPYSSEQQKFTPYAVLSPPYCIIYQLR